MTDHNHAYPSQSGPCLGCGAVNYPLSMGGPDVCPACDVYPPETRAKQLGQQLAQIKDALGAAYDARYSDEYVGNLLRACLGRPIDNEV